MLRGEHAYQAVWSMRTNLFSFWCNSIQLVNEDDGRSILLCLLEGLPQVTLRLTGKFAHDLRP